MKTELYNKISVAHFASQLHLDIISETKGFIISKRPNTINDQIYDLQSPHIVEGIGLVFCTRGTGRIKVNFQEHEVRGNTVLVLRPNNIIQILEQSEDLMTDFLFFTFDFISGIWSTVQLGAIAKSVDERSCLYLNEQDFSGLLGMHRLIVSQYDKKGSYREKIIQNLLYAIIYQMLQLYEVNTVENTKNTVSHQQKIYMEFMTLLYNHYRTERSVQFYASQLFLTRKYFSKIILDTSGKSPLAWIDEIVVMAAKALLKSTTMTISQIADELNFANPSFFGTYFKKQTGLTPVEYRQKT